MTATASPTEQSAIVAKERERVRVWDLPLRLFHWLLVVSIAVAFLSSEEDSAINDWHVLSGWVAGLLIVFRLVWGFVGGEHSRFADFIRPSRIGSHLRGLLRGRAESTLGHNPLGGLSVVVLLALVAATVVAGAFGGGATEDLHELLAWTLLAFVGLHVAAVLVMSLLQGENLVRAMITGRKDAAHHPEGKHARRPGAIGIFLTAAVLAASAYGILRYDPRAFTLRPAEAFEDRAASPGDSHGQTSYQQGEEEDEN